MTGLVGEGLTESICANGSGRDADSAAKNYVQQNIHIKK